MVACLCLLGHLNSLRGIKSLRRLFFSIYLFTFNPLYPLVKLLFDVGWTILKAQLNARRPYTIIGLPPRTGSLEYYIAAAIGVHAAFEDSEMYGPIKNTSTSLLRLPPSLTQGKRGGNAQGCYQIGRLIVLAVAGVQCSAAIVLGVRRELHGTATPSDRRYYSFAVGGLAILAQTLVAKRLSYTYTKERPMDSRLLKTSKLQVSIFTEILHFILTLCIISYFAGDGMLNLGMFIVACSALMPTVWPWDEFLNAPQQLNCRVMRGVWKDPWKPGCTGIYSI